MKFGISIIAASLFLAAPSPPLIFTVTNTSDAGPGSLREMMTTAAATPGADSIQFDAGVFATPQTITLLSALPTVSDELSIIGPGASLLTIRRDAAAANFRPFTVAGAGSSLTLSGLKIADGSVDATTDGGAVHCSSSLTVTQCVFDNCSSGRNGGALYLTGALVQISGTRFTGNAANGTAPLDGGGAIYILESSVIIADSTFDLNSASSGKGGAIQSNCSTPIPIVSRCTFLGNQGALGGGAIAVNAGSFTLRTSTLNGNISATADGGGVLYDTAGTLTVTSCTITGNSASNAGGGLRRNQGTVTLQNTILSDNTAASGPNGWGSFDSLGHNLIRDTADMTFTLAAGDQTGVDPLLGGLTNNGGAVQTMLPQPTSPVRDAGFASGQPTDARGRNRTHDLPSVPNVSDGTDIGAVEWSPTILYSPAAIPPFPSTTPTTSSAAESITISGTDLVANVSIAPVTVNADQFEVATAAGGPWSAGPILVGPVGGAINTTVFVRFSPTSNGPKTSELQASSTEVLAACTLGGMGGVGAAPSIVVSNDVLNFFVSFIGAPSNPQSYTVGGTDLIGPLTLTASAEFEISTAAAGPFATTLVLTPAAGTIATTDIFVRFLASMNGPQLGAITHTSLGAASVDKVVSGQVGVTIEQDKKDECGFTGLEVLGVLALLKALRRRK